MEDGSILTKNYFAEDFTSEKRIKDIPNDLTGDGIIPTYCIFIDKWCYFQQRFLFVKMVEYLLLGYNFHKRVFQ